MVPVLPHQDETLAAFLSRCRTYATAHREIVVARYDGLAVNIRPRMTAAEVADAWMTAKRIKNSTERTRKAI